MKVSLVTISYNQASFLEQAILSVVDQNYKNLEYIIVDAGSTDGSHKIIEKYSKHFSHMIIEPDHGPADGLNKGFRLATGQIFGALNADDMLAKNAINTVAKYFNNSLNVDIVSGHCIIIDHQNRRLRKSYSDKFGPLMYAYGAAELMQPSTFFTNKCFFKTKGYNKENLSNWDSELFIDMYFNGSKFGLINKFLSFYRLHPSSITSSKRMDNIVQKYYRFRFKKLLGREFKNIDILIKKFFLLLKYIKNPLALFERLLNGKIYGRHTK